MRKVKLIGLLVLLAVIGGIAFYMFGSYSEGDRAGTVIKLSRKGYTFKTYEGELNLSNGAAVQNLWDFSVPGSEKETIAKLEKAMLNGDRVKLHYEEKFVKLSWRGDTKYMVTEVQEQ